MWTAAKTVVKLATVVKQKKCVMAKILYLQIVHMNKLANSD